MGSRFAVFNRTDLRRGMGIQVLTSKEECLCRVRILHELLCPSKDGLLLISPEDKSIDLIWERRAALQATPPAMGQALRIP